MIEEIIKSCPKEIDLTNDNHSKKIIETTQAILQTGYNISDLKKIEKQLINENNNDHTFVLLSLKIAMSKLLVATITEPVLISVVFAVYKEHNRIKKSSEHAHGENFLLKKTDQLEWLFHNQPKVKWELIVVDDGCPEGSGKIAQNIITKNKLNDKAKVLFLADAIKHKSPPVQTLNSTNESQKGGSIIYGMWDAIQQNKNNQNQIVVYTDADLSTHLGQLMLLINPILNNKKLVSIGSRREPRSVVIKKGTRNNRGKLFIYLWKRLIPNLNTIIDTQCGFKAFKADIVPEIITNLIEKKFAFDIELLLKTQLYKENSIAKVPIAWIDSEDASTTTDLQPYLPMLKSIALMNKKYFNDTEKTNEFAQLINSLNEQKFNQILKNIPKEITNRTPDEFTEYNKIKAGDFIYE